MQQWISLGVPGVKYVSCSHNTPRPFQAIGFLRTYSERHADREEDEMQSNPVYPTFVYRTFSLSDKNLKEQNFCHKIVRKQSRLFDTRIPTLTWHFMV